MVKQVPDTANISGQVMKADGTVNRGKLPAVFNPEDKVALEMALRVKDKYGGKVTVVTMGPPKATNVLRECLYMGADHACLISDRKFAGADTLATSYVLSNAIQKIDSFDIVFAGRQAIDGDTAQVGPQTAEKMKIAQVTYAENIEVIEDSKITIRRRVDNGFEIVQSVMPVLITVIKDACEPRPFKATRTMAFKNAKSLLELERMADANSLLYIDDLKQEYISKSLYIQTYTMDELELDVARCGLACSPTKVHKVESVVLGGGDHESIEPNQEGLAHLIGQLGNDHIFG